MTIELPHISIDGDRKVEGGLVIFTIRMSEPASDPVTVNYDALSGTALRVTDFYQSGGTPLTGSLTFAAGETAKTLAFRARDDRADELDESFFLELRDPKGAAFGDNIHSLSATGWVLDTDGTGSNRAIAVSNPVVSEAADGKAIFTVSLSQAYAEDRSFSFTTFDGTAKAGSDYVEQSGTVTFLAGQTEATVEVVLRNDTAAEATESFGLSITGAHGVAGTTGTARIQDGDGSLPVLSIDGDRKVEGGFVIFTIRMSEPASDPVKVNYDTLSGTALRVTDFYQSGGTPLTGSLTFAAGETAKTLAFLARDDRADELDESFFLELRDPKGAVFGDNIHSLSATGWVLDTDGTGSNRAIAVSNPVVSEAADGKAIFTVSLSQAASASRPSTAPPRRDPTMSRRAAPSRFSPARPRPRPRSSCATTPLPKLPRASACRSPAPMAWPAPPAPRRSTTGPSAARTAMMS